MRKFYFLLVLCIAAVTTQAQVSMSATGSYSQNFDGLPSTGTAAWTDNSTLANWYAQRVAAGTFNVIAGDGASNSGGFYSFGAASSTERAFGSVGSGTPSHMAWGLLLRNNSSQIITDVKISYTGEQWRNGGNASAQTASFYFKTSSSAITALNPNSNATWTSVAALNFTSLINTASAAAIDGNTNKTAFSNISIPSLSLAPGDYIMIKWDDPDNSGSDHGLSIDDLTVSWTVPAAGTPTITTGGVSSQTGFTYVEGAGPSSSQNFTVTGLNLTSDIVVTPSNTDFEIATSAVGPYQTSALTLTQSGGNVSQAVYVRLAAGLSIAGSPYSGTITLSTTGVSPSPTVSLSGSVTGTPILGVAPASLTGFNTTNGTSSVQQSFVVTGSSLSGNATVTAPTDYEVSLSSGSGYGALVSITPSSGSIAGTTVYVRIKSSAPVGSPAGNVTVAATGATTQNVAVSGTVTAAPVLDAPTPSTLSGFSTNQGTTSAAQSFIFSGSGLNTNATVTAPMGYEVSTDNSVFNASVSITPVSGAIASQTIYVRIKSQALAGTLAGNVSITATGATTQNVAVSGTVATNPVLAFTPGNIAVYRVGDGSAALAATATQVYIDEYTPSGSIVQSIALPNTAGSGVRAITAAGNASSEGMMSRSGDGKFLIIPGYDASIGASVGSAATANRMIGVMNFGGVLDTTTALSDAAVGGSFRSAASSNGTDLWGAGSSSGIRYAAKGSKTSTQVSATITNIRAAAVFNGQLYVSAQSGAYRLATVGTGLPNTSGSTITNLPNFPTGTGSPYGFFFADLDAGVSGVDVVYVADDGSNTGFQKYSLVGGNWVSNGNIAVAGNALRGLTAKVSGTTVTLIGTNPTTIFSLVDNSGYNGTISGTPTVIGTAPTNTAFRGVTLAPQDIAAGPLPVTFTNIRAAQQGNGIKVSFTNQTETDVVRYEIERSGTGRSFIKVAELAPARNNGGRADYALTDAAPLAGENIYRVKSIETNGKITYSAIARVNTRNTAAALNLYPNPVKGADLSVQLSSLPAGKYSIRLVNAAGQVLQTRAINHNGGSLSESLGVNGLASGLYSVQVDGPVQLQKSFLVQQ